MEQVTSVDGTTIAYTREGSGDPVLLVHGGPSTGDAWAMVAPHLAARHTVAVMDRRGRGASGDGEAYSLDLEAADIAAVVTALGGGVHLVGHSSGGCVAARAATRSRELQSLTLYEPPLDLGPVMARVVPGVEELLRAGDASAATELFFSEIAATPEELDLLQSNPPAWDRFVRSITTVPREASALGAHPVPLDVVRRIDVPVLLLCGELTTAPHFLNGLDELQDACADVRRAVIPGQRHLANAFTPEVFAQLLESFLDSLEPDAAVIGTATG